jgi:hypothetical protein
MRNRHIDILAGMGFGAGLMFLLDPQQGRRRRATMRDQASRLYHDVEDLVKDAACDISHRARGFVAEIRAYASPQNIDDDVLIERIRSRLGRVVSHPRAIEVRARQGKVSLAGHIPQEEVSQLLACARSVPGVHQVENRLEVHDTPDVSGLQGGHSRLGERRELLQNRWSPGTCLGVGVLGTTLLGYGLTREAPEACVLGTAGLLLMTAAYGDVRSRSRNRNKVKERQAPAGQFRRHPSKQLAAIDGRAW